MLNAGDVAAGKLLVQLGFVGADEVRAHLRAVDASQQQGLDLVASLQEAGRLDTAQLKAVRRYQAMFEHVRQEAVFLRSVEKRDPPLDKNTISDVLAKLEVDPYRRRLATVLVELGVLDGEEAQSIERKVRRRITKEDLRVLDRYREEDFSGVGRPLVPAKRVETRVFRVSELFRSKATQRRVRSALDKLLESGELDVGPSIEQSGVRELMPSEHSDEGPVADEAEVQRLNTSRFRASKLKVGLTSDASDLGARKRIGAYEVVECVGQGGMGAVYLAREQTGTMLAVKVMLAAHADAEDLARFEREIALMKRVQHPNVVNVLDEGTTPDGLRFVAMPFYAGKDLSTTLAEAGGALAPERVFRILGQLLVALQAVHEAGVVHRDLKPENVFILAGGQDEVRLVDFGIARVMDGAGASVFQSKAGVISGSPAYVAPETIAGAPIDGRTDIYSLGVMLYALLTGRLPLWGESPYDYLREHMVGVPLTLFQGNKQIRWHEGLETLVAQMLAKELDQRPTSCREILTRLQGGLAQAALAHMQEAPAAGTAPDPDESILNKFFKRSWF